MAGRPGLPRTAPRRGAFWLERVQAAAIEHTRAARALARQRRQLMEALLAEGFSQADLARELGVTRQAIQKTIAVGQ